MDIAFQFSALLALGMGAQWLAWYLKQPSVLFLLFTGIIIGPVLGWFQPDAVMGNMLFPCISLGVAIILFEGALTLQFHEISQHGRVVQNLVTLGALITIIVLSLAAYWLFKLDLRVALLFGALVCVTGPTVIAPMLRSVRPRTQIANILRWEGIIIDPIGAIAVVLVYEYIVSNGHENSLLLFSKIVLVAIICGGLGAVFLANAIKRYWLPEYMRNVVTFAFVLTLFSLSNYLESQSGLLTVTILGLALANWPQFPRQSILAFNESLTLLFIPTLFIILAARIDVAALLGLGWRGLALLCIAMFVARPLAVWFSSINSGLNVQEKLMISWIGPRGIVAASIASLFALRLQNQHLAGTELLAPMVFLIIIGTVLIQGLGAKTIASLLKVREPGNNGVLIVGSNEVALMLANTLKQLNIDVLVADYHY
ncbi:MAG: sodium:proton antiporter, partial [Snodgrassella sp.]|uniref:cation:proton antiporter n=1 Tax=Snodgrassella sp. TaxID=2815304 RepID=UPI002584F988